MLVAQGIARRNEVKRNLAPRVEKWFRSAARDLPWRRRRSPYGTLVSEAMLQQTQVDRVVPAWRRFVGLFPSLKALASAPEDLVLEAWRGLGYYRRARNLHATAKEIVQSHSGIIPREREALEGLPGIGPYSAGAIASIGFGAREAIVDANVARVLMRVHGRSVVPTSPRGRAWLWERAREYVDGAVAPSDANEGLMELGAIVCSPTSPKCGECPLRRSCDSNRRGTQDRIPRPRTTANRSVLHVQVILALVNGRRALVRRDTTGLWAGLMFPPTIESPRALSRFVIAERLGVSVDALKVNRSFSFLTTHRSVRFRTWNLDDSTARKLKDSNALPWTWHTPQSVERLSITSAMRRLLEEAFVPASQAKSGKRVRSSRR